ncbi:MAG: hypothetical protein UHX00_11400 [Caryophanon sp.]|nr:hypothetical protein [Caryophanon sp.]
MPISEDDVYGELSFQPTQWLKAIDTTGIEQLAKAIKGRTY